MGERFEIDGVKYVSALDLDVKADGCAGCVFNAMDSRFCTSAPECDGTYRADGMFVIFVKESATDISTGGG